MTVSLVIFLLYSGFSISAEGDLTISVLVGRRIFKSGEPIPLELRVRYGGGKPLILNFSTTQRCDFQIEKERGRARAVDRLAGPVFGIH